MERASSPEDAPADRDRASAVTPREGTAPGPAGAARDVFEALVRRGPDGLISGGQSPAANRAMVMALQKTAGNAAVARLLRQLAPPGPAASDPATDTTGAVAGVQPARGLIRPDDGPAPAPGSARQGEFLDVLKAAVTGAAQAALTSTAFQVAGCPWVEHWIEYYRSRSAAEIEAAIVRYAPEAAGSATAQEYIAAICARVRDGVARWEQTGEIPEAPADTPGDPPGAERPPAPVALALRAGVHPERIPPRELQRSLGDGRPLDGAVSTSMGRAFGADFSRVRIHDDAHGGALTTALDATAFAVGGHIAFAPHAYAPGTLVGDALIAHELAHVVQQGEAPVTRAGRTVARTAGLESDADAAAASVMAVLHGGVPEERGLRPALRSGLRLSGCWPRTVGHEDYTKAEPFDQPKLDGKVPDAPKPDPTPVVTVNEGADRLQLMSATLDRIRAHFDKDQAVGDAVAKARGSLGATRTALGSGGAAMAARIDQGQAILDRIEASLLGLEKVRVKLAGEDSAERGRSDYLDVVDKTRAGYVDALAAALGDKQAEAFVKAETLGRAMPRQLSEVTLALAEKPQGDHDADSKFRQEVEDWVTWMRDELDKLEIDAKTVADARAMHAPDLADREKKFTDKTEFLNLALRGLVYYDRASRAERILEGFKISSGIQDDLVKVLRWGRDMYTAAMAGKLDTLRERVDKWESNTTIEPFFRAVPAFKMASDFAASLGIVLIASIATAGVGAVATAAIGETATLGGTLLAAGGTAAIEAFTFTFVDRGLQTNPAGSFLNDFAWNFGMFGIMKGVGIVSEAAAEAASLPKRIGAMGAAVASFPLMHGYGVLRFRYERGRWPTTQELNQMTSDELIMFLGVALGTKLLTPDAAKAPQLARMHSEYGVRFEGLEIARNQIADDYRALLQKGGAADKPQMQDLQKKAQLVEDTFKQIKDDLLKDTKVDWDTLKKELDRADMRTLAGSAELLAKALGVPEGVKLRAAGGDSLSYTFEWGRAKDLADGLRALGARVDTASDPVSGRKTLTAKLPAEPAPMTFLERGSPFPAGREVEVDPAAPEIARVTAELAIKDPAAVRELLRMIQVHAAKNPGHPLPSHLKPVRRAIVDAVKSGTAPDAETYLKDRARTGAIASTADAKLVTAAKTLEAGGLLKSPEWLEVRDPSGYVGLIGEALAAEAALAAVKPGQSVLRNVQIIGDAFTDAAMTKPAISKQGRAIVDTDVVPELDLMSGQQQGTAFVYDDIGNVKAVEPATSADALKSATSQSADTLGALRAHEAGTAYQRPDGTYVRIKKVTAIDAKTGATVDLTGKIKADPAGVRQDTIGPAKAAKGKDDTKWSQRLTYTRAEIGKLADLLQEMQAMKSSSY